MNLEAKLIDRLSFGFHNPNHAAALACALLPLCWGWRRGALAVRAASLVLFAAVLLTRSRTGIAVAALEWVAWMCLRPPCRTEVCGGTVPARRLMWPKVLGFAAAIAVSAWWMWPRIALDCSILNRPAIWLAGLRLFAANPSGVGLGNSGALASAYLTGPAIPEVRTLVSSHLTLLAEFGWLAGWAWLSFVLLAVRGIRRSPRAGIAFAGFAVSACVSTVFDWPVLFDIAAHGGGLGIRNWALLWTAFALFAGLGARLVVGTARAPSALLSPTVAALLVIAALLVPHGDAPHMRGGWAVSGDAPRTLALHDGSWSLRAVRVHSGKDAVIHVRPILRFPRDADFTSIDRVQLFGRCREWVHLVKGTTAVCVED